MTAYRTEEEARVWRCMYRDCARGHPAFTDVRHPVTVAWTRLGSWTRQAVDFCSWACLDGWRDEQRAAEECFMAAAVEARA